MTPQEIAKQQFPGVQLLREALAPHGDATFVISDTLSVQDSHSLNSYNWFVNALTKAFRQGQQVGYAQGVEDAPKSELPESSVVLHKRDLEILKQSHRNLELLYTTFQAANGQLQPRFLINVDVTTGNAQTYQFYDVKTGNALGFRYTDFRRCLEAGFGLVEAALAHEAAAIKAKADAEANQQGATAGAPPAPANTCEGESAPGKPELMFQFITLDELKDLLQSQTPAHAW